MSTPYNLNNKMSCKNYTRKINEKFKLYVKIQALYYKYIYLVESETFGKYQIREGLPYERGGDARRKY